MGSKYMYRVEYKAALYSYSEHTEYMHIITSKKQAAQSKRSRPTN